MITFMKDFILQEEYDASFVHFVNLTEILYHYLLYLHCISKGKKTRVHKMSGEVWCKSARWEIKEKEKPFHLAITLVCLPVTNRQSQYSKSYYIVIVCDGKEKRQG